MVGALPRELLDKIKADGKKGGLVALGFGQFAWLSFFFPPKKCSIHTYLYDLSTQHMLQYSQLYCTGSKHPLA